MYDTDCYTRSQALGYARLALKEMAAKKVIPLEIVPAIMQQLLQLMEEFTPAEAEARGNQFRQSETYQQAVANLKSKSTPPT